MYTPTVSTEFWSFDHNFDYLKLIGVEVKIHLINLLLRIWESDTVLEDLKNANIVTTFQKGNPSAIFLNCIKLLKILLSRKWQTYAKIGFSTIIVWFFGSIIWKNRARKHPTILMRPGFIPIIGHLHLMLSSMFEDHKGKERLDHVSDVVLPLNVDLLCVSRFGNFTMIEEISKL